jgi:putative FmdB family regulatory protein
VPTYQYVCTSCEQPLEAVQSFSDAALTECPACGGRLRKVYGSVGVVFKGSGFYKTDSRAQSGGKAEGGDGGSSDKGSGDKGTGDKKDAVPAAASSPSSPATGSSTNGSSSSNGANGSSSSSSSKAAPAPAGKSA